MRNCESIDPLVTPYVDRELAELDRHVVDEHIHACPPCQSRVTAEQAVHDLIQARQPQLRQACAPPVLRTACAQIARLKDRASQEASRLDAAGPRSVAGGAPGLSRA